MAGAECEIPAHGAVAGSGEDGITKGMSMYGRRGKNRFALALQNVPAPGGGRTHSWCQSAANAAAWDGIDATEAERQILEALGERAAAHRWCVASAIRRAYQDIRRDAPVLGRYRPTVTVKRKPTLSELQGTAPKAAAQFVELGRGIEAGDIEAEMGIIDPPIGPREEAVALLRALFKPGEGVWAANDPTDVRSVRACDEWIRWIQQGHPIPTRICPNPIRIGGRRCDADVTAWRHLVGEFDDVDGWPLARQLEFWWGYTFSRDFGPLDGVTALVFSGNKSYHAFLRVDCADRREWDRFAVGRVLTPLVQFGADPQFSVPSQGARMAGAIRNDEKVQDAAQRLLFVRGELEWEERKRRRA